MSPVAADRVAPVWRFLFAIEPAQDRVVRALRAVGLHPRRTPGRDARLRTLEAAGLPARRTVEEMLAVSGVDDVARVRVLRRRLEGPATASLDYAETDWPTPCPWCAGWRAERTRDVLGHAVLREWHHGECPRYREWS